MKLLSHYLPIMPHRYVYMLQTVEYRVAPFRAWLLRRPDLTRVMQRGSLIMTNKARGLLAVGYGCYGLGIIGTGFLLLREKILLGAIGLVLLPVFVQVGLSLTVCAGSLTLLLTRQKILERAKQKISEHPATKIAVLGSYGKTTVKELLLTILSEAKNVKATPGNMNVPISHARWITNRVDGKEEVLIFEYGEGKPGDITRFARLTRPNYAFVTGVAPNHLDQYSSYEVLKADLASITDKVRPENIFINFQAEAELAIEQAIVYGQDSIDGWTIHDVEVDYQGTSFTMEKGKDQLKLTTQLLGKHQVGSLAAAAVLAMKLGLTKEQIKAGVAKTAPFEHRMQPRPLHGAWIIDDTYNGNLEGIRVGLELMKTLPAKRKVYVTPGLVDQGSESERVHQEIGRLITEAQPNKVVLMKNSVTDFITAGLNEGDYNGEVIIETDPLGFYTNLEHVVAAGDLYMLQNDWPDNYA